jgi:hypothetical protein
MAEPLGRRAFLGLGAALAAAMPFSRTAAAAALSATDRANVATVMAMAETWKSVDVAKRNTLFTPDAIFRGAAERIESAGQKGPFRPGPVTQFPVIEMHTIDAFALDPLVITSHHQLFPANVPPHDDWYVGVFYMRNGLIREWLDWAVWQPKPQTAIAPNFGRFHQPRVDKSRMSPQDVVNTSVVDAMCASWQRGDVETIGKYFSNDCHVRLTGQQVEEPPLVGVAKAKDAVTEVFAKRKVTIETHDVIALDPTVVACQRHLIDEGGTLREAWNVGEFFVQFGHIREWVNYEFVAPRPRQTAAPGFGTFTRVQL